MIQALDLHSHQFPETHLALNDPPGLLASGGDLSPFRLVQAYLKGIFPWYSQGTPILWWSPPERAIITPEHLHQSRSLRKTLASTRFQTQHRFSFNEAFSDVIHQCAGPRQHETGTWITPDMILAYENLHQLGIAHSIELWQKPKDQRVEQLVGGLYGICLGPFFFGESMFSRTPSASKFVLVHLVETLSKQGLAFLDCQMMTDHLESMGAMEINRETFQEQLTHVFQDQLNASPLTLQNFSDHNLIRQSCINRR